MVKKKNDVQQHKQSVNTQNRFTFKVNFPHGRGCRRKSAQATKAPTAPPAIPRVARLLALAHHLETQVRTGTVKDYAELASLLGVSRARITQLLNLLFLAPDIQEEILFLPPTKKRPRPTRRTPPPLYGQGAGLGQAV
ncbi:MAG: hypothetical protein J7M19_00625 [Planctomycetes bacterium]|nr:hypothetical protein [Planctomycetota bacterium]